MDKMDQANLDRRVARIAALIYLPLVGLAAGGFTAAAIAHGQVGTTVVVAGAVWVALLTLIVLMPLVIPAVRSRVHSR